MGVKKTIKRVLQKYYWPGLAKCVENYVKNCKICRESKFSNKPKQGMMGKPKKASKPFQILSVDLVGPLTRSTSQNSCILTVTDWFTKFPFIFPLRSGKASKIASILEENVFMTFGIPEIIIMDNGKQFLSKILRSVLKKYNITPWFTSLYHPQANFTERTNQTLGNCLRAYARANQRHWDKKLSEITLALRTAVHSVTGYSPFFLVFNRECATSASDYQLFSDNNDNDSQVNLQRWVSSLENQNKIHKQVLNKIDQAYVRNKLRYDKDRRDVKFEIGDRVFKRNYPISDATKHISAKLLPRFTECIIVNKKSDLSYDLADINGKALGNYHIQDIISP